MADGEHGDRYLFDRAEVELAMAQKARSPEAMRVHQELASRYLDRFHNPPRDRPRD